MQTPIIREQMKDFDKTVETIRQCLKAEDTEGIKKSVAMIFPYVIHYLRERNYEKLRYLGKKLAHITFDFDDGTKNLQIARQLGYLQALENVIRKMMDSEVSKEAYETLRKQPRYGELLSIIKREGIIEHDELAHEFGVSPEQLGEIVETIRPSEAITVTTYGIMRYYVLTTTGEAMYDRIRKQAFLPELAHRLKEIYKLVMHEGKSAIEVLRLVKPKEDDWCSEDEILPIVEALVEIREENSKVEAELARKRQPQIGSYEELDYSNIYKKMQSERSLLINAFDWKEVLSSKMPNELETKLRVLLHKYLLKSEEEETELADRIA